MKLDGAQKQGCCLGGQPAQVIEVIRDIISRIRRNLTQADRDKYNQNRRDTKKLRSSMPYQDRKNIKPPLPSKLLEIKGAVGIPKVTMDEASIKALKRIEECVAELSLVKGELEEFKNANYDSKRHDGKGLLLINSSKAVFNGIDVSELSDQLLAGQASNNQSLITYLNFEIRGVTKIDESLAEMKGSW
jgi:hypothetical protein